MNTKAREVKVQVVSEVFELDMKRGYLPIIIDARCGACGEPHRIDVREDYIMYPKLNEEEEVSFECQNEHQNVIKLKLNIQVEVL